MKTIEGFDVKIFTDNVEETALNQIRELLSIDVFSDKKIRIMPDVHAGAGCVIGFTGDLGDKVIPNIVGVDIGCGMRILRLGRLTDIDYHAFHEHIEPKETARINRAIGSLGGGNHFIELDRDDDGDVYLVIHTGSRNLGKQVADLYQAKAVKHLTPGADDFENTLRRTIEEYKAAGRRTELQGVIKRMIKERHDAEPTLPAGLCYVEGETRERYLHDMRLCQRWAMLNRRLIATLLMRFFPGVEVLEEFESVHNYISDDNIIRKGSISAAEGERCIIPLNMRDGSLLCTGKGNPDWNRSAPHGAGRVLSRSQAYEKITMEDFVESMRGIYTESVNDYTRDESPMVYKPAEEIIANIGDTVTIDAIIRPIFNFKAS